MAIRCQNARMKNIQIIDGTVNTSFSVFQATAEEVEAVFPSGHAVALVGDLMDRLG